MGPLLERKEGMFQPCTWHLCGTKRESKETPSSTGHPNPTATSFLQRRFQSYVLQAMRSTSGQLTLRRAHGSKKEDEMSVFQYVPT